MTTTTSHVVFRMLSYGLSGDAIEELDWRGRDITHYTKVTPKGAIGFYFVDITVDAGGRRERHNVSPVYYIDAEVLYIDDLKKMKGDYRAIIRDMKSRGHATVMRGRTGLFVEIDPSDTYAIIKTD